VADAKAPVAIRIVRPYGSPEEFVRGDLEALTKTSITLAGAQPRPKGVILRFEVTLANGRPVMRGEGRVLGYTDEAGLSLRFTRLDPKSKALVDWAAGIKDARAKGQPEPAPPELPSGKLPGERPSDPDLSKHAQAPKPAPPPSVPPPPAPSRPPPPARAPSRPPPAARPPSVPPPSAPQPPPPASEPTPSVRARLDEAPTATSLEDLPTQATTRDMPVLPDLAGLTNLVQRPPEPKPRPTAAAPAAMPEIPPEKKSELLERLRSRARELPAERVRSILEKRASS
jgi:hypothetical protein